MLTDVGARITVGIAIEHDESEKSIPIPTPMR
jgi:hypothetical protein